MSIRPFIYALPLCCAGHLAAAFEFTRPIDPMDVSVFTVLGTPVPACFDPDDLEEMGAAIRKEDWARADAEIVSGNCIMLQPTSWGTAEAAHVNHMLAVNFIYAVSIDPMTSVTEEHRETGALWVQAINLRTLIGQKDVNEIARAPFLSQ